MVWVALLRGVNVGGNRKVDMKTLKGTFEAAGMSDVRTYINSGNVVFASDAHDARALVGLLEEAIRAEFGFPVTVLVRNAGQIAAMTAELPDDWANDSDAKCDVIFLGETVDGPDVLDRVTVKPGIDDVRRVPGALLWRVERPNVTRSGLMKLVGTDLYANATVRNCNTLRKLAALMTQAELAERRESTDKESG